MWKRRSDLSYVSLKGGALKKIELLLSFFYIMSLFCFVVGLYGLDISLL